MEKFTFAETIQRSKDIAYEAHKGQYRTDGKDYITHPEAVVELVSKKLSNTIPVHRTICTAIGWLHDVFEDNPKYRPMLYDKEQWEALFDNRLTNLMTETIRTGVISVTRNPGEDYSDFIIRVSECYYGTIVKLEDLRHNLSDSKPGARRDKYMLAYLYLTGKPFTP